MLSCGRVIQLLAPPPLRQQVVSLSESPVCRRSSLHKRREGEGGVKALS
jgi:hypothetical protein